MAAKSKAAPDTDEVARWKDEIHLYDKDRRQYVKRCDSIVRRYRDERDNTGNITRANDADRRMNILWSNVQTLKPSIYAKPPVPIVERRFLDSDETGRVASQILERTLRYNLEDSFFHDSVGRSVLDYLLVGRGQIWLRYEPYLGDDPGSDSLEIESDKKQNETGSPTDGGSESETPEEDAAEGGEQQETPVTVVSEAVCVDYVDWKNFRTFPAKARTWAEVEAVSRELTMSRADLKKRFGDKIGQAVPLDMKLPNDATELFNKATVYEIWNKGDRCVYFIAKEYGEFLEEADDPLELEGFWPCPRPLFATLTNDTLIPVPDYAEYQDQAMEIDQLTARIALLTKALRVAGVYDASTKGNLDRLINEDAENKLIPVNSWAAFAEKGGLNGAISWLPIEQISNVLAGLVQAREAMKQDLYEVTGMSDIIRGQSDPNETATAQAMKGQFASRRLRERQLDVARYCRDIVRLMGEIIAEHFTDDTLVQSSGIMHEDGVGPDLPDQDEMPQLPQRPQMPAVMPQDPQALQQIQQVQQQYGQALQQYQQQMAQIDADTQKKQQLIAQAIALLRQDKNRGFRIEVETDTMIADDVNEDKQLRVQFIQGVASFLQQALPAGQQVPALAAPLARTLMWAIRGFRVGRDLESAYEQFADKAEAQAKEIENNPQAAPPHPEQIKAQAEQAKAQAEQTKQQGETERAKIQSESEINKAMIAKKTEDTKLQRTQLEQQIAQDKQANDVELHNLQKQAVVDKLQSERELSDTQHLHKMREIGMQFNGKSDEEIQAEQQAQAAEEMRKQAHEQMLGSIATGIHKLHEAHAQLHLAHANTQGALANVQNGLNGIATHISLPTEIVRDAKGNAVSVRKGSVTRTIVRDASGRPAALH